MDADRPAQPAASAPDPIFADPRLARIYDDIDGERSDLDHYLAIAEELHARTVLDVGCGTGTLACLMAGRSIDVIGVDPAAASLDVAQRKPGADRVRWLHGDATSLPPMRADLAVMTGNVAQVFLTDEAWSANLRGIRSALAAGGSLVFETRDPSRRGWEEWTRPETFRRLDIDGVGVVETWAELTDVSLPLVSFRHTYRFLADDSTVSSDSTLRFRSRDEIRASVTAAGFSIREVRDAPDRPGRELVFVAGLTERTS